MSKVMPLAVLDKCVDSKIWIIMKSKRQFAGTLRGFDDYFNMVLDQVIEIWEENGEKQNKQCQSILLNGHDIVYMVPGFSPQILSKK